MKNQIKEKKFRWVCGEYYYARYNRHLRKVQYRPVWFPTWETVGTLHQLEQFSKGKNVFGEEEYCCPKGKLVYIANWSYCTGTLNILEVREKAGEVAKYFRRILRGN